MTKRRATTPDDRRVPVRLSTRDRIIDAGMALFAERGVSATRIGDIEEAAGLTRRGGGFYRHFDSKSAVLEAGIENHILASAEHRQLIDLLPLGDVRAELTLICRWLLSWLDSHRDLQHILEKEGATYPQLRDRVREAIVHPAYEEAKRLVARWSGEAHPPHADAVVIIMMGAVENYRRATWTFGVPPMHVDQDEFVRTWVSLCIRLGLGQTDAVSAADRSAGSVP